MTEDREIFAIYTPLVRLVTYDKTGDDPDVPTEKQVPCLSDPGMTPAESMQNYYSKAWFMTCEGGLFSDTPFEQPYTEDPTIDEYEFSYMRYIVIPFTLKVDGESYSTDFTLFCSTYKEPVYYEDDDGNFYEDGEITRYSYSVTVPLSEEEAPAFVELQYQENDSFTILIDDQYEVPLGEFRYRVKPEGEEDPEDEEDVMLLPFAELASMLEDSGEVPYLITGAEAEWVMSAVPVAE